MDTPPKIFNISPDWSGKEEVEKVEEETASYSQSEQHWESVYKKLNGEIKVRHYSPKTYKAYSTWVRKFQHIGTCFS